VDKSPHAGTREQAYEQANEQANERVLCDSVEPPDTLPVMTVIFDGQGRPILDIYQRLGGVDTFEVTVGGSIAVLRATAPDEWNVYVSEDLVGSFVRKMRGRATYFESEIASEPGTINWVSDDIGVLISRMITLRE